MTQVFPNPLQRLRYRVDLIVVLCRWETAQFVQKIVKPIRSFGKMHNAALDCGADTREPCHLVALGQVRSGLVKILCAESLHQCCA